MRVYPGKTFLLINNPTSTNSPPFHPSLSRLAFGFISSFFDGILYPTVVQRCFPLSWFYSQTPKQSSTFLNYFSCQQHVYHDLDVYYTHEWLVYLISSQKWTLINWHRCWYDGNQISFWTGFMATCCQLSSLWLSSLFIQFWWWLMAPLIHSLCYDRPNITLGLICWPQMTIHLLDSGPQHTVIYQVSESYFLGFSVYTKCICI